jgi:hypothetical protein
MSQTGRCSGGNHHAPRTGGSCPCGMVTRLPVPTDEPAPEVLEVLALLARCLGDGIEALDAGAALLLRERADRLLAAFSTAGLEINLAA